MKMEDIDQLSVRFRGREVGILQLSPERDHCVFSYSATWLKDGFSLSPLELPLQNDLFHASPSDYSGGFAVFEDSLPDGYGLYLLNRLLRKEGTSLKELSVLQRLSLIGETGMGALCYLPARRMDDHRTPATLDELDSLQEKALEVLSEKSDEDADWLYYNSGNSGGARPKVLLTTQDGKHLIVKFRHVYDPVDAGQMEYLYMNTARRCGIVIPDVALVRGKYLAVERFDIQQGKRMHVLSAAALLKKDFRRQDVDYKDLLALTGYLTQDSAQVEQMFRLMVFNIIADNKDDHAKNFSFICDDGLWHLAPAYDLTYAPAGTRGEHATSVMYAGNPTLEDIIAAGTGIRIPRKTCLEIIDCVQTTCRQELPTIKTLLK